MIEKRRIDSQKGVKHLRFQNLLVNNRHQMGIVVRALSGIKHWTAPRALGLIQHSCLYYMYRYYSIIVLLVNDIKGNIRNKNKRNTTVLTSQTLPFTFSLKILNLRL